MNGKMVPWKEANVHVLTHTLHYGGGAFEGIRCYDGKDGPAVFRLREHIDRLFYSAKVLNMQIGHSADELCRATVDLLRANELKQGYIRPLVYYGYGVMGLNPRNAPTEVAIACWPWGAYLPQEVISVKTSKYIRIHPQSTVADAKICGHYVNSILAVLEIKGTHYHEALFLDAQGNVAEGPGENLFVIKKGKIYTPALGPILAGITRSTVIELARDAGIEVTETTLRPDDIFSADEAFFTGTAAEVVGIGHLDDRPIGDGGMGSITKRLRETYLDVVYGRNARYERYLTKVNQA
jgi:branched-chain amino acid aminotransferase